MSVSWRDGGRRAHGELVQMNNLYGIPGIVCQGDDGRPVCKPKQTEEDTHTLAPSRGRRTGPDWRMWELLYFDREAEPRQRSHAGGDLKDKRVCRLCKAASIGEGEKKMHNSQENLWK